MSLLYAIDPGTLQSALVVLESDPRRSTVIVEHTTVLNAALLPRLNDAPMGAQLVIEQIEAMGMAVGAETFETVFWSGRFYEAWPNHDRYRLARRPIKLHLCGAMQAKDANIRQALLDKFGGKDAALGRKHAPGPLYGLKGHEFAALAVGVTWLEQHGTPIRAASTLLLDVGAAHMVPPIRTA
jgi:hypothetical protein